MKLWTGYISLAALLTLAACSPRESEAPTESVAASEAASSTASSLADADYTSASTMLACDWPVKAGDTAESLLKTYKSYAQIGVIPGPEGTEMKGVILYGSDPRRKVEVVFGDTAMTQVSMVIIRGDSQWSGPKGLHLGSTLADVEAANGKPFELSGFEWDYGGYVTDLKRGKLDRVGKCTFGLRFGLNGGGSEAIMGDRTLKSNDAAVVAANPVVQEMTVGWAVPEPANDVEN